MKNYRRQVRIPGIIGGMGPYAHILLENNILEINAKKFNAKKDTDYPIWITISATDIPDRTESIINGKSTYCTQKIIKYCEKLKNAGADFIVIPCNTAHVFLSTIKKEINIPVFNVVDITCEYICKNFPSAQNIGILATDGTIKADLYHKSLIKRGHNPIDFRDAPDMQKLVMDSIYSSEWGIKAMGNNVSEKVIDSIKKSINFLLLQNCNLIISGCTEISVAISHAHTLRDFEIIDPLKIVAEEILNYVYE